MCHTLTVKIDESAKNLLSVHAHIFLANLAIFFAHLCHTFVDVLQVDAEDVVLNDLRVEVLDDVFVVQLLVSLNLLLNRLHFLLVKPQIWMHELDHFDGESLPRVNIQSLVDLACRSIAQLFANLPLNCFSKDTF